jgi:hypothetical protein
MGVIQSHLVDSVMDLGVRETVVFDLSSVEGVSRLPE